MGGRVTACRVVKREGGPTLGSLAVDPTLLGGERACPPPTPPKLTWVRVLG